MSIVVDIDFETYAIADLLKVGAYVYASDAFTGITCLAAKYGQETALWVPDTPEEKSTLGLIYQWIIDANQVWAHNVEFEREIWLNIMIPFYDAPTIAEHKWRCSASLCSIAALPRKLEKAGEVLGLTEQKDKDGHRAMLRTCKPDKKGNWKHPKRDPELFDKVYDYCRQDVTTEADLRKHLPPITGPELEIMRQNIRINENGIPIDRPTVKNALTILDKQKKQLHNELSTITNGEITTGSQVKRIIDYVTSYGVNIENLTAGTVKKTLKQDIPQHCKRILEIRQILSKSSTSKYESLWKRSSIDGRVHGSLIHHKARTGRYGGTGIQPQNLPSRGLILKTEQDIEEAIKVLETQSVETLEMFYGEGSTNRVLSALIRPMIKAPAKSRLLICDYNAIEARCIAWAAYETKLLREFDTGSDPYRNLAAQIYNKPSEEITGEERFHGKSAILGGCYGMGAKRFRQQCKDMGVEIGEDFAEKVIKTYRTNYPRIPRFWYAMQDAAITACSQPGNTTQAGRIRFKYVNPWLQMVLPSNRRLWYRNPKIKIEETPFGRKPILYIEQLAQSHQWQETSIWGGVLTENAIQAIARDFLCFSMYWLEKANYKIIFHVHDEIITEMKNGKGSLSEMIEIMERRPKWGLSCPIKVEGFEWTRYRKD